MVNSAWRDIGAILTLGVLMVLLLATGCVSDGTVRVEGWVAPGQTVTITSEGPSPSASPEVP